MQLYIVYVKNRNDSSVYGEQFIDILLLAGRKASNTSNRALGSLHVELIPVSIDHTMND